MVHWLSEILVMLVLIGLSCGQEDFEEPEPVVIPINTSGPILLTSPDNIDRAVEELAVALDHLRFLSHDYWPVPLNNSSVLNLTA